MTEPSRRPPPAPRKLKERRPWPMKYVVVAILAFVALSTWVNLRYRKPGPGYRPYEDTRDRATTARLLAGGWHKMPVDFRRPAESPALPDVPAAVTRELPGLGADLEAKFAEKPQLLASIDRVVPPATVVRGQEYAAYFTATVPDLKDELGDLTLYRRGNELVLVPTLEALPGSGLRSRWNDSDYWASFPTASLTPGRYRARIVARGRAAAWSFTVK